MPWEEFRPGTGDHRGEKGGGKPGYTVENAGVVPAVETGRTSGGTSGGNSERNPEGNAEGKSRRKSKKKP